MLTRLPQIFLKNIRSIFLTTIRATPFIIDNDGRGERVYDVYSRLLKDRIICVMSPVIFFLILIKFIIMFI